MKRLYFFTRRHGVTLTLLAVMECILAHDGCLIDSLARWMGVTRTPIHNHLHRLRTRGLIRTTTEDGDSRLRRVSLTEDGRKLIKIAQKLTHIK